MTDKDEILKAIGDLRSDMTERFDKVEERLNTLEKKIDVIDGRLLAPGEMGGEIAAAASGDSQLRR